MAVAREELERGGRVFLKTRLSYGGAALAMKLKPARVIKVERAAATIELIEENNRRMVVPFNQLEPDDGFLDERDRREAEKLARIQKERAETERALAHIAPPTLRAGFADKLSAFLSKGGDDDEPLPDAAAQARMRIDALAQLSALSDPRPLAQVLQLPTQPTPEPAPPPAPPQEPTPQPEPIREPDAPPPPPAPAPTPTPQQPSLPLDAMSAMLQRIQAEFEKLISEEVRLEALHADALKALADLDRLREQAAETSAALDRVRARQRVLSAQERQVLAVANVTPASAPAQKEAPAPAPAQPATPDMPIAGPERGQDGPQDPTPVLRGHDTAQPVKRRPGRPLGSKNKPKSPPAEPAITPAEVRTTPAQPVSVPAWLRRPPYGRRPVQPDLSDPLERAIEQIVQRKEGKVP